MPRPVYFFLLANLLAGGLARGDNAAKEPIDQLIPSLLREDGEFREIPFSKVIFGSTGN